MENVALDYLPPLQRAQLQTCRRDIFHTGMMPCQRCGGDVLSNYGELKCLQCGAQHDHRGNWLEPKMATGCIEARGFVRIKGKIYR